MGKQKMKDGLGIGEAEAGGQYSRIPPGEYEGICFKTKKGPGYGDLPRLYLFFRIQGGEYHGTELFMVCTHGSRKFSPRTKYYLQWSLANGGPPVKGQRLSPKAFLNKLYLIQVRDTKRKHKGGRVMADFMQYSVVDTIIEPLTGIPDRSTTPSHKTPPSFQSGFT